MGPNRKPLCWVPLEDLSYAPESLMPYSMLLPIAAQLPDHMSVCCLYIGVLQIVLGREFCASRGICSLELYVRFSIHSWFCSNLTTGIFIFEE